MATKQCKQIRSKIKNIKTDNHVVKSLRQLMYEVTVTYGYVLKIECDVFIFVFEFLRLVIRLDHDDARLRPWSTSGIDSSAEYGEW